MLNVLYVTSFFTHWSFFTYCSCIRKYCCNLVSLHLAESPLCQRSWHTKSIWGSFIFGIWETHICSHSGMPWESDCLLLNWLVSFNSSLLNRIYNLYSEFLNSVNYFLMIFTCRHNWLTYLCCLLLRLIGSTITIHKFGRR